MALVLRGRSLTKRSGQREVLETTKIDKYRLDRASASDKKSRGPRNKRRAAPFLGKILES